MLREGSVLTDDLFLCGLSTCILADTGILSIVSLAAFFVLSRNTPLKKQL